MSCSSRRRSHAVSALRRTRTPPPGSRTAAGPAPAGASGRKRPGIPAARRSPHRSSAAGRRGFRVRPPGWRGAGRERLAFPGAARPWVRDDGRSAPPAVSSPAPAGPATASRGPGRPARGTGKRGKAPRASCAAERCGTRPPLPEGKAGRGGRGVVPGGDLVRALAVAGGSGGRPGCRPAGRAGLPPGTAGIHPPLRPPRQVARRGGGLGSRPRATRRYGPAPARPAGGDGPGHGPPPGRVPRRGHGGAHRDGARHRRARARRRAARYGLARLRAARYPAARICHGRVDPACRRFSLTLHKSGFRGPFSPATPKIGTGEAKKHDCCRER